MNQKWSRHYNVFNDFDIWIQIQSNRNDDDDNDVLFHFRLIYVFKQKNWWHFFYNSQENYACVYYFYNIILGGGNFSIQSRKKTHYISYNNDGDEWNKNNFLWILHFCYFFLLEKNDHYSFFSDDDDHWPFLSVCRSLSSFFSSLSLSPRVLMIITIIIIIYSLIVSFSFRVIIIIIINRLNELNWTFGHWPRRRLRWWWFVVFFLLLLSKILTIILHSSSQIFSRHFFLVNEKKYPCFERKFLDFQIDFHFVLSDYCW